MKHVCVWETGIQPLWCFTFSLGPRLSGLDTHAGQNNHSKKSFKVSCRCFSASDSRPDVRWSALVHETPTIWRTEQIQNSGYLQSGLHGRDSGATERAGVSLVSAAVGLTNTQEEHAGGQARRQRQGAVDTDVWSTDRESSDGRENTDGSDMPLTDELVRVKVCSRVSHHNQRQHHRAEVSEAFNESHYNCWRRPSSHSSKDKKFKATMKLFPFFKSHKKSLKVKQSVD